MTQNTTDCLDEYSRTRAADNEQRPQGTPNTCTIGTGSRTEPRTKVKLPAIGALSSVMNTCEFLRHQSDIFWTGCVEPQVQLTRATSQQSKAGVGKTRQHPAAASAVLRNACTATDCYTAARTALLLVLWFVRCVLQY